MAHQGRRQADAALLLALACGATAESAARSVGVSPRTVHRRLAEAAFCQRLQVTRADIVQRTTGTLTAASLESVKTLLSLQHDGTVPPAVRLGAARAVLEFGIKLRDQVELEQRLSALEGQSVHNPS